MAMRTDPAGTAKLLLSRDNILILCHKNPDGDTLGSAARLSAALSEAGKTCAVVCHNRIPVKYDYMKLQVFDGEFKPEYIVAVDIADENLLGDNLSQYRGKVDLCIDHHVSNSGYAKNLCLDRASPAAAQIMLTVIEEMGVPFTKYIADCLYTGIITDTGCFRYSSTTADTHIAAAKLLSMGADHTHLAESFFMSKTRRAVELEKYALNNIEYYFDEKCAVLCLTKEVFQTIKPRATDIDGLSSFARDFEWVEVSVLIRPQADGKHKISIRTGENARANRIAAALGGGGHIRAAGCEVDMDMRSTKQAILKEVEKELCRQTETE